MRGDGRTHPAAEEGFAPAPGAAAANRRAMARSERKAHVAATGRTPEFEILCRLSGSIQGWVADIPPSLAGNARA